MFHDRLPAKLLTRLSVELATWARRLEFSPYRLRRSAPPAAEAFAYQLPQPRQIVDMLASIGEARQSVEAASPFEGADIEALVYPEGDTEVMLAQTKHAITLCLPAGFALKDLLFGF